MNESFPTRIGYHEACDIVSRIAAEKLLGRERLAVSRADGRTLANDLHAPIDLPVFDNSRMDGYAVRHADLNPDGNTLLRVAGEQFAGVSLDYSVAPGECIRITTGAPMPVATDTVVAKEKAIEDGGQVTVLPGVMRGTDIRRAGEDARVGELILKKGSLLSPARLGLAAALGIADLEVARLPTVAVFTLGDELVEPGLELAPGQIYNSNRELLMGLLRKEGLEPVAWPTLPDDPLRIQAALHDAASAFDVVITCGGVSVGEKDYLPKLLMEQGEVHFWKVMMKPGMPLLFGSLDNAVLLGLPGNPVSVLATLLTLGRRLLQDLQGRAPSPARCFARLLGPWTKSHDRMEFLRGHLQYSDDGALAVRPDPADGSHRLRAAADSDALIVLAGAPRVFESGTVVEVLPY